MPAVRKVPKEEILKISFSKAKIWRKCKKAYDYRYNQRLRKKKPPAPLIRGTIVHELIDASIMAPKTLPEVVKKFEKKYGRLFDEEREIYGDPLAEAQDMLARYKKLYKNDGLSYVELDGRKSEIELNVPMTKTIHFFGKIDRMPKDPKNRIWVSDTKTCKKIPDEETRFSDIQTVMYVWAALQLGIKPAGVMWDYIRTKVPTVPEVLKKGGMSRRSNIDTTWDVYKAALEEAGLDPEDYGDMQELLKGKEEDFFRRIWLPYSKHMVQEVFEDLLSAGEQIQRFGKEWHDRSPDRMCKTCQYYLVCSAELRGLDAEFIRKTEYEVKEKDDGREEIAKVEE